MADGNQHPSRAVFGEVSGLEYQLAIANGEISAQPFHTLLGLRLRSVQADGRVVFDATPRPEFANSAGRLHGGYLSAVMDCATAAAAHTQQPAGVGVPHIHASYRFLASADHRSPLIVSARLIHVGRSVLHATAEIRTEAGDLIAAGETIHKTRSAKPRRDASATQ
jgi:uncharacterized protein (TIGR00369 family)